MDFSLFEPRQDAGPGLSSGPDFLGRAGLPHLMLMIWSFSSGSSSRMMFSSCLPLAVI